MRWLTLLLLLLPTIIFSQGTSRVDWYLSYSASISHAPFGIKLSCFPNESYGIFLATRGNLFREFSHAGDAHRDIDRDFAIDVLNHREINKQLVPFSVQIGIVGQLSRDLCLYVAPTVSMRTTYYWIIDDATFSYPVPRDNPYWIESAETTHLSIDFGISFREETMLIDFGFDPFLRDIVIGLGFNL